ncbi:MAG: AtpZ/AtpI family protein [Reichenbachiella sp.]
MENHQSEKQNKKAPKPYNYLRFSGLAFEMLAFILLGVWGGHKLDELMETEHPWFMIVCSLSGVTASLVNLIRKLPKE